MGAAYVLRTVIRFGRKPFFKVRTTGGARDPLCLRAIYSFVFPVASRPAGRSVPRDKDNNDTSRSLPECPRRCPGSGFNNATKIKNERKNRMPRRKIEKTDVRNAVTVWEGTPCGFGGKKQFRKCARIFRESVGKMKVLLPRTAAANGFVGCFFFFFALYNLFRQIKRNFFNGPVSSSLIKFAGSFFYFVFT